MAVKFEKVIEGWDAFDSFFLAVWIITDFVLIYATIVYSPFWIIGFAISLLFTFIGISVFLERKVYWRKINGER